MQSNLSAGLKPGTNIGMRERYTAPPAPGAALDSKLKSVAAIGTGITTPANVDAVSDLLSAYYSSVPQQCTCQSPASLPSLSMDQEMALHLSVGQVCLHRKVTDAILPLARRAAAESTMPEAVEYLLATIASRSQWHSKQDHRHIVSLGETCLPKTVPTKWGLKCPKSMGELTMPFDLAIHPTVSVGNILRDRFATYLSEGHLSYDNKLGYVIDPYRSIHWNHETELEYAAENFKKHKERYLRRINNLNTATSGRVLWFLASIKSFDDRTLTTFANDLKTGYPENDGRLAILTSDEDQPVSIRDGMIEGLSTSILNLPLPMPGYEWWFYEHFATRKGLIWERAIIDWLADLV